MKSKRLIGSRFGKVHLLKIDYAPTVLMSNVSFVDFGVEERMKHLRMRLQFDLVLQLLDG